MTEIVLHVQPGDAATDVRGAHEERKFAVGLCGLSTSLLFRFADRPARCVWFCGGGQRARAARAVCPV